MKTAETLEPNPNPETTEASNMKLKGACTNIEFLKACVEEVVTCKAT